MQKRFDKTYTCDILVNTQAEVAELADALDSKSGALWACGFDSHLRYHFLLHAAYDIVCCFFLPLKAQLEKCG